MKPTLLLLSLFSSFVLLVGQRADWMLHQGDWKATLVEEGDRLYFTNGLVQRVFSTYPNGATIGYDNLVTGENLLRSVRPEAQLTLSDIEVDVGGLQGQPIQNYLATDWLIDLRTDSTAFQFDGYKLNPIKARFPWKPRVTWLPESDQNVPHWPPAGKELVMTYRIDENGVKHLMARDSSTKFSDYAFLKNLVVEVHYVLYDNLPVLSKWITVVNEGQQVTSIDRFTSELLAAVEGRNSPGLQGAWSLPNITIQTDYDHGGAMSYEMGEHKAYEWQKDTAYLTQIDYQRRNPCLLVVRPEYGPGQIIAAKEAFNSYRVWELVHDTYDRERKGLQFRKMMRVIAPWVAENPIMMHARFSDDESVKSVIDQCAEVGFEMVILTFGSGVDLEDESPENLERMRELKEYADSKGISIGGYSLLASRRVEEGSNVVSPPGITPRFGNAPCVMSEWGNQYFRKLYQYHQVTGHDVFEHDGSYPGDVCASTTHSGHRGLADSRWKQFKRVTDFYKWCRANGIYLNIPDWYFLNGGSKVGMGYRETNWSLPRAQQAIIERQNIYDGTWEKTPSMGWMHVPLMQYHGGGQEATYEPLSENLNDYEQRYKNLFSSGVQAAWRGRRLYDNDTTQAVVKKWVDFYKAHRPILDSDIIHVRRPDGRDYDAILHVNPLLEEKGMLVVHNPTSKSIRKNITLNVYYTGLHETVKVSKEGKNPSNYPVSRDYTIDLDIEVGAGEMGWWVLK